MTTALVEKLRARLGELPQRMTRADARDLIPSVIARVLGLPVADVKVQLTLTGVDVTIPTRFHYLAYADAITEAISEVVGRVDLGDPQQLTDEHYEEQIRKLRDGDA